MEWWDTTIIIKFNVIIFVRLEQWNFLVAIVNNVFQRWRVVFESLLNLLEFLVAINNWGIANCKLQIQYILLRS